MRHLVTKAAIAISMALPAQAQDTAGITSTFVEREKVCGSNELLDSHLGCLLCSSEVGVTQFGNFICNRGNLVEVFSCRSGPDRCPYPPGAVCQIYGEGDFLYVGEAACFSLGPGIGLAYGRCTEANKLVGEMNVDPADPRCVLKTIEAGGDPRK